MARFSRIALRGVRICGRVPLAHWRGRAPMMTQPSPDGISTAAARDGPFANPPPHGVDGRAGGPWLVVVAPQGGDPQ